MVKKAPNHFMEKERNTAKKTSGTNAEIFNRKGDGGKDSSFDPTVSPQYPNPSPLEDHIQNQILSCLNLQGNPRFQQLRSLNTDLKRRSSKLFDLFVCTVHTSCFRRPTCWRSCMRTTPARSGTSRRSSTFSAGMLCTYRKHAFKW
jgi:hypothetical protein